MPVIRSSRLAVALVILVVFLVAFALLATAATAASNVKPPSKQGNLRATAKTLTSVAMARDASTDNSGNFSYRVRLWGTG